MNDEQLERKIEELENRVERLTGEKDENSGGISRRGFLKKSALGLAGLGALTLPAAGKISITGSGIEKDGNDYFHSGLTTDYDLAGENLTDGGTTVFDASQQEFTDTATPDTGKRTIPFNIPTVNLQPGETAQLARFQLSNSQQLDIEKASVSRIDGTTSSNLELEVYNHDTSTSEYTTTSTYSEGSPLATIKRKEVEIRVKNTSGSTTINAQAAATGTTEEIGLIVDDFEDGDLSEYGFNEGGDFSIVNSPTYEGNHAVARTGTTAPQSGPEAFSTSGLPAYPQRGDTFRFRWLFQDGNCNSGFWFAVQSETEIPGSYRVTVDNKDDLFGFRKYDTSGNESLRDEVAQTYSTSEWYYIKVYWKSDSANAPGSGNNIVAVLYDSNNNKLNQHGISDSTYDSGGIGFNDWGPIEAPTITIDKIEIL